MAYKDKDKQREANRQASKKYRDSMTGKGMTVSPEIIPKSDIRVIPERTAQGNIRVSKPGDTDYVPQCETTRAFIEGRAKLTESAKRGKDIEPEVPGMTVMDERSMVAIDTKPKRGKDITCFADLPSEVQRIIEVMSTTDGKLDQTIKANRTAIAINYQHQFPDRYHSTGVV